MEAQTGSGLWWGLVGLRRVLREIRNQRLWAGLKGLRRGLVRLMQELVGRGFGAYMRDEAMPNKNFRC